MSAAQAADSDPRLRVRAAGPGDTDAILRFALALAQTQGEPTDILDAEAVRRDMLGPGSPMTVLIAELDGTAAGYAALLPAYETSYAAAGCFVSNLFVAPGFRRKGVARGLMAAAARHAASKGGVHLWLTMLRDNDTARPFYRRLADISAEVTVFAVTRGHFDGLVREGETVLAPERSGSARGR